MNEFDDGRSETFSPNSDEISIKISISKNSKIENKLQETIGVPSKILTILNN